MEPERSQSKSRLKIPKISITTCRSQTESEKGDSCIFIADEALKKPSFISVEELVFSKSNTDIVGDGPNSRGRSLNRDSRGRSLNRDSRGRSLNNKATPLINERVRNKLVQTKKPPKCIICGQKATTECEMCQNAYYCSELHKQNDWEEIHSLVCDRFWFLKFAQPKDSKYMTSPTTILRQESAQNSELERKADYHQRETIKEQKKQVTQDCIQMSLGRAKKRLYQLKPRAATACLKVAGHLLKPDDCEDGLTLRIIYVKAFCMIDNLCKAELELRAIRILLSEFREGCPADKMADYYGTEGLYNTSSGKLSEALNSYANEVYFATEAFGTDHTRTALGFFHLGQVFLLQNKRSLAYEHYLRVVDTWTNILEPLFEKTKEQNRPKSKLVLTSNKSFPDDLTQFEILEATAVLDQIYKDTIEDSWDGSMADSGRVCNAKALLHFIKKETTAAKDCVSLVKLDRDNDKDRKIFSLTKSIKAELDRLEAPKPLSRLTSMN